MPAQRDDVIRAIRDAQREVENLVGSTPEPAWSKQAYEGWNAKQLLCHVASTSGVASFLIGMAQAPGWGGSGAGYDQDAWNAQQVAARQEKPIAEITEEARGWLERGVESVLSAPEDLLARPFRTPWGVEGPLSDVIVSSFDEHLMVHVRDIAKAVA